MTAVFARLGHAVKVGIAAVLQVRGMGIIVGRLTKDMIPCRGIRISTASPIISPRTKAAMFWGLYENRELRCLKRHLRPDLDVVDLGASIGVSGAHAARRLRPGIRYVAVEANPALHDLLARNLVSHSNSVILARALDASPGAGDTVTLALGPTTDASRIEQNPAGYDGAVAVRRQTLSDLLRQEGLSRFQLLCDIEGSEASLFLNDPDAFRHCELMIIELHRTYANGRWFSVADLRDLVLSLGFRIVGQEDPVYVFSRRDLP